LLFGPKWVSTASLWKAYVAGRVDKLQTMFFWHFKHAAQYFMTSKGFFAKKKFCEIFDFFLIFEDRQG